MTEVLTTPPVKRASCPYCGREGDLLEGMEREVVSCDECGTMIAHGAAQPRVVIYPHPDPRFVTLRLERVEEDSVRTDPAKGHHVVVLKLAKEHAAVIGKNLASIS